MDPTEQRMMRIITVTDDRQYAPATARNRDPILAQLKTLLPAKGSVLEIASGTGEHGAYFSAHLPNIIWQPTNYDQEHLASTAAWQQHMARANFLPVLELDATSDLWPIENEQKTVNFDAIFNANMIHISPWQVTQGIMKGAARVLPKSGLLILYGPYKIDGAQTSQSNIEFEKWLKAQDSSFGVRDIELVIQEAEKNGLAHRNSIPMPANNFIQVFEKA
jgi:SAM-dependent methyltransferase